MARTTPGAARAPRGARRSTACAGTAPEAAIARRRASGQVRGGDAARASTSSRCSSPAWGRRWRSSSTPGLLALATGSGSCGARCAGSSRHDVAGELPRSVHVLSESDEAPCSVVASRIAPYTQVVRRHERSPIAAGIHDIEIGQQPVAIEGQRGADSSRMTVAPLSVRTLAARSLRTGDRARPGWACGLGWREGVIAGPRVLEGRRNLAAEVAASESVARGVDWRRGSGTIAGIGTLATQD